jgi:hypothetical protein
VLDSLLGQEATTENYTGLGYAVSTPDSPPIGSFAEDVPRHNHCDQSAWSPVSVNRLLVHHTRRQRRLANPISSDGGNFTVDLSSLLLVQRRQDTAKEFPARPIPRTIDKGLYALNSFSPDFSFDSDTTRRRCIA